MAPILPQNVYDPGAAPDLPGISHNASASDHSLDKVLIDVRTAEEHAGSAIPNSFNIPYTQIRSEIRSIESIKSDTQILLYCRSGRRSGIAAQVLVEAGFTNVRNLGGLEEAIEQLEKSNL